MKLTPLNILPDNFPKEVQDLFQGAKIYDSSCSPEARVYFADKDGGYFLKVGKAAALEKECVMTRYFHSLGLGAEVVYFESGAKDLLVTRKVSGRDLTSREHLENPKLLAKNMGECLRALHETQADGCPVGNRTNDYLEAMSDGYRIGRFDSSFIDPTLGIGDMESAVKFIDKSKGCLEANTLLHGDFCLPNVIFDKGKLSGYIDLGGAGIGDRHVDLFWGAWTLNFNLHTDEYRQRFFDAYGRDRINDDVLKVVAAAEVFG
jgi:kanamycin kinase